MDRKIYFHKGQIDVLTTPGTVVGIGYPKIHSVCQVLEGGNTKFLYHHWEETDYEKFCKEISKRT